MRINYVCHWLTEPSYIMKSWPKPYIEPFSFISLFTNVVGENAKKRKIK